MSYTEFHTGKLYPVRIEKDLETTCRIIATRFNIELGDDWEEDFRDHFDEYKNKKDHTGEEYFIHGEKLYRVIDHEQDDSENYFMKLNRNSDGSISFVGQFYNGGTCFCGMLEDALDELKPLYKDRILEEIRDIIDNHGEETPTTVPGAAKLIKEYKGLGLARELFTGAMAEVKDDPFKYSAYKSTLETTLKEES